MHPYHHALTTVKQWGGKPEDYVEIHAWFDATKEQFADARHRARGEVEARRLVEPKAVDHGHEALAHLHAELREDRVALGGISAADHLSSAPAQK